MKKIIAATILFALVLVALASCDRPAQLVQAVPAGTPPVVVAQQSDAGFWRDMMFWHMFAGGNTTVVHHYISRPAYVAPRAPVVNNTTIINKTYVRPALPVNAGATRYAAPKQAYSAPPRATSYSGSYSSRSSYRSFSSSRR
jgi:hypothetical protein